MSILVFKKSFSHLHPGISSIPRNKKSKSLFSRLLLTSFFQMQTVHLASSGVILGAFKLKHSSLQ